jgi:hypothetical protein
MDIRQGLRTEAASAADTEAAPALSMLLTGNRTPEPRSGAALVSGGGLLSEKITAGAIPAAAPDEW